eukprot:scaffold80745_cov62-Phaeocystis_antarctica.AAC.2
MPAPAPTRIPAPEATTRRACAPADTSGPSRRHAQRAQWPFSTTYGRMLPNQSGTSHVRGHLPPRTGRAFKRAALRRSGNTDSVALLKSERRLERGVTNHGGDNYSRRTYPFPCRQSQPVWCCFFFTCERTPPNRGRGARHAGGLAGDQETFTFGLRGLVSSPLTTCTAARPISKIHDGPEPATFPATFLERNSAGAIR